MRKIDVLLLSALIMYDYGAQTLTENTFTAIADEKHYAADSLYLAGEYENLLNSPETIHYLDLPEIVVSAPARTAPVQYVDLPEIVITASARLEQYLDLPEIVITASRKKQAAVPVTAVVTIDMPDAAADIPAEIPAEASEETAIPFIVSIEKVSVGSLTKDPLMLDTDGDGIFDYEDSCIDMPGVARFNGCPVPDSDHDGVNDEEDHCPFEAGAANNNGCPVQTEAIDFNGEVFTSTDWISDIPDEQHRQ